MSFLRGEQGLYLQNAKNFIGTLQRLEFFVHNVSLKIQTSNKTSVLTDLSKQLLKSISEHKLKAIKLWMQLIERMNNNNMGITPVHLNLLYILTKENHYQTALDLITNLGLPVYISIHHYQQYLLLSAEVYHEFEKYHQALECLTLANSLEDQNFEFSFMALKLLVLTHQILGFKFDKKDFIKDIEKIKLSCQRYLEQLQRINPQKLAELNFEFEIFSAICEDRELNAEQIDYLKKKQLFDLYSRGLSKQMKDLKYYIRTQIADPTLYRIKCSQIKNVSLNNFQTLRDLNKIRPIFKYDQKNRIMYFQHQQADQEKLDELINQACMMQNIIKNRPIQTKTNNTERDETEGFGPIGMGGIGGFFSDFLGYSRR